MLKVLHTADWHVGRSFDLFELEAARKLARDRVTVVDRILGLAEQYDVDAVLCAGDLFDNPVVHTIHVGPITTGVRPS